MVAQALKRNLTGEELISLIMSEGPQTAVEALHDAYNNYAIKIIKLFLIKNRCRNPKKHTEEIISDTWESVIKDFIRYFNGQRDIEYLNPRSWLKAIAINHAVRHFKEYNKFIPLSGDDEHSDESIENYIYSILHPDKSDLSPYSKRNSIEDQLYLKEVLAYVEHYLSNFSQIQQAVFSLYINDVPYDRIIKILSLKMKPNSVSQMISRMIRSIRSELIRIKIIGGGK